ncbi:multicomponent Na+:H+ antiporter subunit E [Halorubrum aquaticum]|uniref:Multicomponent Na+:H+ antiporter subunit E n=1 Tax=Halorubrum aquaticum TaxID=387340 RepID=A0A1I3BDI1_9EURY|nr:monovalent cation/H+ antiporter subunit E [Halorubrum aquaticum]SFH59999.1 multicomponent Na+:H+ antiporter subunit E [Halorubrum aquaticum]
MVDAPKRGSVVVPVESTPTLRATVTHLVESAAGGEFSSIHFVVFATWRRDDPDTADREAAVDRLLERVATWAEADLADVDDVEVGDVEVVTAIVGDDEYLFGADDYVRELAAYADEHDAETVVLDPEYTPVGNTTLLQPLEFALSSTDLAVREAPVTRPTRRERLRKEATGIRFAATFALSLAFYLALGDPLYWFDLASGVASAAVVAITLSRISLDADPSLSRTPIRLLRGAVYVPALLYEILKSNVVVARVILDPRMPIDPTLNRVRVIVGSGLPITTLANSITLTPGTLTVRARDGNLYVHSLIPWARDGLFDGSLERWTRFVFYGREAARLPTPRERDDVGIFQGPDATEEYPGTRADGGSIPEESTREDSPDAPAADGPVADAAASNAPAADGDEEVTAE